MNGEYIKSKLLNLPHAPGSYQMKDQKGTIIYVGKAKDLHNRVNSYFTGAHDFKTTKMVSHIEDFDFIVTKSEKEALVLEINLIKKYRPEYNIQFIDDSSYPYIKLTKEKYPRLVLVRDSKKDKKAKYFGPFPDVYAAKNTQKLLQSLYPYRRCVNMPNKVCLYYHLGQCLGPCVYDIDPAVYEEMNNKIIRFMNGNTEEIRSLLEKKMQQAAENLEFEKAEEYKNMLDSIDSVIDKQNIEKTNRGSFDVYAWYADRGYISMNGFLVRNGTILKKEFRLQPLYGDSQDAFTAFIMQYYQDHPVPSKVIMPLDYKDAEMVAEALSTSIVQPQKGYLNQLIQMSAANAKEQLELKFSAAERQQSQIAEAVAELNRLARHPMNRVELFDNSHISGTFTVASCVVYQDGMPQKNDYRLFKLHTGNDDMASMQEVLYRRYFHLLKENERLPDGILVDGGRLQIEAALKILQDLGITSIKVMGLVKDDHHNTSGLMDTDFSLVPIDRNGSLFFLLTRMQDEVHRTAISYHRKLRSKAQTRSILDEIEGIGPQRKKILLREFGSLSNIRKASVEELAKVIPQKAAENVYTALHEVKSGTET